MSDHKLPSIAEQWEEFAKAVLRPGTPDVQRREMRRAFYAGVASTLTQCQRIGEDDVHEDEGCLYLTALTEEVDRFVADMLVGKC